MNVDEPGDGSEAEDKGSSDRDSDDEEVEDTSDIAMVPMADILNARYDSVNVSHVDTESLTQSFFALA
jgi:SET domain-containing protein 6